MRIYLAGGMHERPITEFADLLADQYPLLSGYPTDQPIAWADIAKLLLAPQHQVFDPRSNRTKVFEDYSFLDILQLRQCDLVIAYLEASNPSGAGLIAEVAFAKGLGKTVLLINEKHDDRYIRFVENFADRVFTTLVSAAPIIRKI